MAVSVRLLRGGETRNRAWLVDSSEWNRHLTLPALVAVIHHPNTGTILFDCGYGRALQESASWQVRLYRQVLPFTLSAESFLPAQADIIFLSHFHPDHVGGLREAPQVPVLHSAAGLEELRRRSPFRQSCAVYFPELMPSDFDSRARAIEDRPRLPFPPFEDAFDITGDGDVIAVSLPGHAMGQYGLLCRMAAGQSVFLVADAAWVISNITRLALPAPPARMLMEDFPAYTATLRKLHELHQQRPDIAMIPSHCDASISSFEHAG